MKFSSKIKSWAIQNLVYVFDYKNTLIYINSLLFFPLTKGFEKINSIAIMDLEKKLKKVNLFLCVQIAIKENTLRVTPKDSKHSPLIIKKWFNTKKSNFYELILKFSLLIIYEIYLLYGFIH